MNAALLKTILRRSIIRMTAICIGAATWGVVIPVIFVSFTASGYLRSLPITRFGSGDFRSLSGMVTVGIEHPLFLAMASVAALGVGIPAIAGSREHGTLELLLARPLGRRELYNTYVVAIVVMIAAVVGAYLLGVLLGAAIEGRTGDLALRWLPLLWLNGVLLFTSFGTFGLTASALATRTAPAMGVTLAWMLAGYFIEVVGSFWDAVERFQTLSLFHHVAAQDILAGRPPWGDLALLAGLAAVGVALAWWLFPQRDIPAPA